MTESESESERDSEGGLDESNAVKGKAAVDWLEVTATVLFGIASRGVV